jgi:retron-type reverse transcriptase
MPCVADKIVQEVIRLILEAIYDSPYTPFFKDTSHGFRPNRSCHTALRVIREQWSGANWYIEGDIRVCFDEVHHGTLMTILQKKIRGQRFLNLIWKLLNAGYMDMREARQDSLAGVPQGGIASPILANAYLHELDEFVERLQQRYEKGRKKRRNRHRRNLSEKKRRMVVAGKTKAREFRDLVGQMRKLPSVEVNDPNFVRKSKPS